MTSPSRLFKDPHKKTLPLHRVAQAEFLTLRDPIILQAATPPWSPAMWDPSRSLIVNRSPLSARKLPAR